MVYLRSFAGCAPGSIVEVVFKIAGIPVEFDMTISYEMDAFQFSPRIHQTANNIESILARYAIIDEIRKVSLIGKSLIEIRRRDYLGIDDIDFYLTLTVYFYESETLVVSRPDRPLVDPLIELLDFHLHALHPIVVG